MIYTPGIDVVIGTGTMADVEAFRRRYMEPLIRQRWLRYHELLGAGRRAR